MREPRDGLAQELELGPPDHRSAFLASLLRALVEPVAVTASCEVAIALGTQLDMPDAVLEAFGGVRRPRTARPNDLTDREVEVLRLTARGLSNKEFASSLVVSPRTVQNHLAGVYDKTGRRTRPGAPRIERSVHEGAVCARLPAHSPG